METFRENLFEGKVVLVTGGGTGIGKAIARKFAKLGASVCISSRKREHLEVTAREIEQETGRKVAFYPDTDVRDEEKVKKLFEQIEKDFGKLDVLVNNAGANFLSPTEELSLKGWNAVIGTILTGTFLCSKYALPLFRKAGEGVIINIGATTGMFGSPFAIHSATGKAGLEGFTKTLAVEWARYKVRVNLVAPGLVETEGFKKNVTSLDALFKYFAENTPSGKLATPEDVANVVVFLASPAGSALNGVTIPVDGGHWFAKGLFRF